MDSILKETDEQLFEEHKMYDAFQYLINTQKNLSTAYYCHSFIDKILAHIEEVQKQHLDNMQSTLSNGETYFYGEKNTIDTSIEILGTPIDSHFLVDKYLKDFIQYSRNAFDSIAQFINKTVLYLNPLDIEFVDFNKVYSRLEKDFPHTQIFSTIKNIKFSDEFKYITEFNNKTKHISDTKMIISLDLLAIGVDSKITPFLKRKTEFEEKTIKDWIISLSEFLSREFSILVDQIKTEIPNNKIKNKRFHKIEFYAQILKNDPQNTYLDVFILEDNIDSLPEEIEYLFVYKYELGIEDRFKSRNFPFEEISIKNSKGTYLGKFKAETPYHKFRELHYRKFRKVKFEVPLNYLHRDDDFKPNLNFYDGYMFGKYIKD